MWEVGRPFQACSRADASRALPGDPVGPQQLKGEHTCGTRPPAGPTWQPGPTALRRHQYFVQRSPSASSPCPARLAALRIWVREWVTSGVLDKLLCILWAPWPSLDWAWSQQTYLAGVGKGVPQGRRPGLQMVPWQPRPLGLFPFTSRHMDFIGVRCWLAAWFACIVQVHPLAVPCLPWTFMVFLRAYVCVRDGHLSL